MYRMPEGRWDPPPRYEVFPAYGAAVVVFALAASGLFFSGKWPIIIEWPKTAFVAVLPGRLRVQHKDGNEEL